MVLAEFNYTSFSEAIYQNPNVIKSSLRFFLMVKVGIRETKKPGVGGSAKIYQRHLNPESCKALSLPPPLSRINCGHNFWNLPLSVVEFSSNWGDVLRVCLFANNFPFDF